MKHYLTPQAKQATGGKRIGLSGSVFLTVAFLMLCCLIAWGMFHIQTNVQATSADLLPPLTYPGKITDAGKSPLLQSTQEAMAAEILKIRSIHGLSKITKSEVLSENAYYIAATMLALGETSQATALSRAQDIAGQLSYIKVTGAVYAQDYCCTSPFVGATHFCKVIQNHTNYSGAILRSDLTHFGVAVLQGEVNGKTVTCAVICSATEQVTKSQSKVPEAVFVSDGDGPRVTAQTVYLATGTTLTQAMVEAALKIEDERGEEPVISWDLTTIQPNQEGKQTLSVTVTDSVGNQTVCPVPVHVATPTLPMLVSDLIELPEIPEGAFWDVAKYVQASDQYGVETVTTQPMFLRAEELKEDTTVQVTVTNVFGLQIQAEVPVVCKEAAYKKVASDEQGTGIRVESVSGEAVRQNGHALLSCPAVENGIYHFTVRDVAGVERTFVRRDNELIWNPAVAGETEVSAIVYKENTGEVYHASKLNIIVADKQVFVYNTLVVSFKPESGFVLNHGKQWMYGIAPGTLISALKEAILVDGGAGEISFSFVNAKGQALGEDAAIPCGAEVSILEDGTVRAVYKVLLYGDTNGDGKISVADYVKLRLELTKGNMISGIFTEAADANRDGKISVSDYIKIRQYLLGRLEIVQN